MRVFGGYLGSYSLNLRAKSSGGRLTDRSVLEIGAMSGAKAGVPLQLLFEAENHVVTIEMKNGETYRGILVSAEETMNCQLKEVTMTAKEGRVQRLEHIFLRGGTIKFVVLPDVLKNAPIFKKVNSMRAAKVKDELPLRKSGKGTKRSRGGEAK